MTPKDYAKQFWNMRVCLHAPKGTDYPEVAGHQASALYFADKALEKKAGVDKPQSLLSDQHGVWYPVCVKSYRLGPSGVDSNGDGKVTWGKKDAKNDYLYHQNVNSAMYGKRNISVRVKRIDGVVETKTFDSYKPLGLAATAPFYGKAFPEEVQVSLQLRFRYQKVVHSLDTFVSKTFIGLDCNGFVGGYLRRRKDGFGAWLRDSQGWGPDTNITTLMREGGDYFTSTAQFQPSGQMLLLGMCNQYGTILDNDGKGGIGHIMISEPGSLTRQGDDIKFEVVESTGGNGLVASEYKILAMPKPGIFQVSRGCKKGTAFEKMLVKVKLV